MGVIFLLLLLLEAAVLEVWSMESFLAGYSTFIGEGETVAAAWDEL